MRAADDGSAVLIVVKDRDVHQLLDPALDLEAAGGGDVLQVDPPKGGGQILDCGDDLLGVLGIQADGNGIHPAKSFEED